jgi:GNAT superfamily N-acetyltransferase
MLNLLSETLSRKSAVTTADALALRLLHSSELEDAAQLVGRGMRDNPANLRVFRIPDGEHRSIAMGRFFVPVLRGLFQRGLVLGAILSDRLVGICGMARPGFCQPNTIEKTRVLPAAVIGNPITTPLLILNWVREGSRRDPSEPHWHLGPVAVEPSLQGQGIGTAMLNAFCAVVDSTGAHAYLETDKHENVLLYQRFGFSVVESVQVLGVPNWFMSRPATKSSGKGVRPGNGGGIPRDPGRI